MSIPQFKLIVVGDGCTGKTTFISRHQSGEFQRKYIPTIGVDVRLLPFYTSVGEVHFEVHDTAGQEKFGGLRDAHYINSNACFLFFDVTSRATYNNVESWYSDVDHICPDIPYILIGNKCDVQNREVRTQAVNWHRKKGIKYVEMSAKSNYNYEVPFLLLCRILARDESLNFTQAPALVPAEINMSEQQMNQIHNDMMKANMAALPDQDE
ncbi:GTP-binding_nuclear protein RAN/TC4 [Hexamita inflata]|uniref:GTP-binding nuclear protein n=1 Tax=Hexamita inflata TaxID=28002 RepID=A0AA86U5G3_9EUKA|nr:GTP-binding nuclear protein RAN/TC4 [Hexamita inflata]CAI9957950.1 GTP-binding nuclear protein RAN/TC4 [Hexamita inflata]CAI9968679.1 GTP-binding nuclear protein RAN/TC4 [Hexamita inflata]